MGLGSLLGGKSSSSKTVTKPSTVWEGQQPYLQNTYKAGEALMNEQLYGPKAFDQAGYDAAMAQYNAQQAAPTSRQRKRQTRGGGNYGMSDLLYWPGRSMQDATPQAGTTTGAGMPSREQFMKSTGEQSQFQKQLGALNEAWMSQLAGPTNPYLTGMASAAMNQISKQFQEQIMPSLLGGGNAAGQLGGERYSQLQAAAAAEAQKAMGDVGQNIYGQAWQSGLDAQGKAIAMGQNVMGAAFDPIMNQARLLGSPTVLSGGGSSSEKGGSGGLLGMASSALQAYGAYKGL